MTAAPNDYFLITAKRRGSDNAFTILAHEDTSDIGRARYQTLMNGHIKHTGDVVVTHESNDTPQKRLNSVTGAVPNAQHLSHLANGVDLRMMN